MVKVEAEARLGQAARLALVASGDQAASEEPVVCQNAKPQRTVTTGTNARETFAT
jgi:hypothetical protein